MMVYVEEGSITDLNLPSAKNIFQFNSQTDKESLTGKVDFIVTLGGDGTLIHASSLFQVKKSIHRIIMLINVHFFP